MADNNPYSIVGAGKTNKNPIETFIDCGESAATVCWVGRLSIPVGCVDGYRDEKICSALTVNQEVTEGTLNWNGNDVFYKVTSGECQTPPSTSCTSACTEFDAYPVPLTVQSGYSGNIDVHYSYYVTCEKDDYVDSRVKKSGVDEISFREFVCNENGECRYIYNPEDILCGNSAITVYLTSDSGCTSGESIDVSFLFNPSYVPAEPSSGTDVDISVLFKKVLIDEECNKKTVNGQFPLRWHVKCTSGNSDDKSSENYKYRCCDDHYVESSITKNVIISKTGAKPNAKIYYNGSEVPNSGITYSILQKGKTTEECSGLCQERTTYCVDRNSVKVYYEVSGYTSNVWSASTEGDFEVSSTGGRIKVTWEYSAHTITDTCYEFDSSGGTWEEIIEIGGCDERPIDCLSGYNVVTINEEGDTSPYDDTTYNGCKICDSECCYEDDGTCRCVILFKEQTPSCSVCVGTDCNYSDIWDDEEKRVIRYNKIRYQFKQTCDNN